MYNTDKIINEILRCRIKNPIIKVAAFFVAIYFIYQAGKAAGEFIYYVTH
jgi:hypothetical protein